MTAPSAARPIFVVPVRDLDDGPKTLSGEISLDWLRAALEGSEATPADRAGSLDVEVSKNGREVLVRGSARVPVIVPCARTLAPIPLELTPEILLLLRKAEAAPRAAGAERQRGGAGSHDPKPRTGKGKRERGDSAQLASAHSGAAKRSGSGARPANAARPGSARGDHGTRAQPRGGWSDDPELEPTDAAQDTFEGEQIVLDSFLREFILLELPMFPVRQDLPSLPVEVRASGPDVRQNPDAGPPSESETPLDPRLAPLAELKDRLQKQKQNKE